MHKMTQQNVQAAFAGEAQAHTRYLVFAGIAEEESKPNIARLFRAVVYAEQVHATNHLKVLKGVRGSVENLDVAIGGETFETEEMYPVYINDAKLQGEKEAEKFSHYALEAEKIHAQMYTHAKQAASGNKDVEFKNVFVCPVCGHTVEGEAPDYCPICGAKKEVFKKF